MPVYEARIATPKGTRTVTIPASGKAEVERILKKRGRVLDIRMVKLFDMAPGLSPTERYVFLLKLSTMTGSNVPLGKALELIAATFRGSIRRVAATVAGRVNTGMPLTTALEEETKSFPASMVALIRAGLVAGNTSVALREAAEFERMIQGIRKGSVKEIYAGIGYLIASAALMIATMEYFGPMVTDNPMFSNGNGVDTAWIETSGTILMWFNLALVAVVLLFGLFGTVGRQISPVVSDRIIARIPFYSDLILAKNNYVTFYKLGLLIQSGVRIEESLRLTERDCPRGALKSDLGRSLEMIRRGRPWAEGMETMDPTDRASLISSTDREDVARTFRLLADQFRDLYLARIQAVAPAVNMAAALLMTAASGVLFGLTILPMLQLAANIN